MKPALLRHFPTVCRWQISGGGGAVSGANFIYYRYAEVFHLHVFTRKMYLNPVPQDVIDRNPAIVQNPGY
ncbi:RagB/SusD family nutrient uptake outer membrane protein [Chitinophaga qingshengii]|uniref:RagB/SusD family nutrient uptake outer membrane protein n=1 Tax=Chitinophaga qingshengii TaxID=1569794 RepID=A0ABR7TVB7_9BACT|nr:RagB/SusD family nutrient uptake outer membrane protein [Chitinophaga qingshengii]MBC9934430.1 RagB/SusD family nutrient uptake outer membrane protein [Chitinophaga qingshengii]